MKFPEPSLVFRQQLQLVDTVLYLSMQKVKLSKQQLLQIMPAAGSRAGVFLGPLNAAMEQWQINTPARIAAFLAHFKNGIYNAIT